MNPGRTRGRCDVVVVGAGLAGLTAGHRLSAAGVDVRVLEADARIGGRIRGEPVQGTIVDTGAEFVGRQHTRMRAMISSLGLRTRPAHLEWAPVLWRLPDRSQVSRLPPVPLTGLRGTAAAWWRLRRQALTLHPDHPWTSPAAAELDAVSLADWLTNHGATRPGLDLSEALIGAFATASIHELSAAHAAWWIAAADGLLPALRSGQQNVISGGAHQIPHRLARSLGDRVHLNDPVTTIRVHRNGVDVGTDTQRWAAQAVIVAVPLPALRRLCLIADHPLTPGFDGAIQQLSYGRATKIAARADVVPPSTHRSVVGGHPLVIAWRNRAILAGIATSEATPAELTADLATAFGLTPDQLSGPALTEWTSQPYIGGSYLVHRPGQFIQHAAALREPQHDKVLYAGADFSSWPNSMEGAVQSGLAAATKVLSWPAGW